MSVVQSDEVALPHVVFSTLVAGPFQGMPLLEFQVLPCCWAGGGTGLSDGGGGGADVFVESPTSLNCIHCLARAAQSTITKSQ